MASSKKQKKTQSQSPQRSGGGSAQAAKAKTPSRWRTPLLVAVLALCVYRGLEYHNYWHSLSPVVETKQGPVQGRAAVTKAGTEYLAFQGLPFAEPPVGPLRFLDPVPPRSWAPQVRDARADGPMCRQPQMKVPGVLPSNMTVMDVVRFLGTVPALAHRALKVMRQSEDCLHLNVYTPEVGADAALPVLVFVHGGAFVYGDGGSDMFGPEHFVDRGVVLVVPNYRLGPFGFLALGEAAEGGKKVGGAPRGVGNAALKDVVAALRWVKDNIAHFGGDPDKVTIGGQSAGGAIASYMTLVPAAKGLFRSAISMSGTALHHWAFSTPEKALERGRILARRLRAKMGHAQADGESPEDALRFLQSVDAAALADYTNYCDVQDESRWLMDEFPFQPTVDGDLVPAAPLDLLRAGRFQQVPTLLGLSAREGLFIFPSSLTRNRTLENMAGLVDADFFWALPEYMRKGLPRGSEALRLAEVAAKEFYFGKQSMAEGSMQQFVDFYGTLMFDYDTYRFTRELTAVSQTPVFAYNFTFEGRQNLFRRVLVYHVPEFKGATHSDDLGYLFGNDLLPQVHLLESDPELSFQKNFVTSFSNFIKTGNPTRPEKSYPKWPSMTKTGSPVMKINVDSTLQEGYRPDHISLWNTFFKNIA
ncbi:esterase B1-like [Thrips palmi]|uniref:Carboxylic ester hydrolase n=1 Tax=Thrips palmi TaxID=161013 RepID=A0A6P8YS79_THRPL|nr:esterase B1-like [Thrips palmi]